MREICIDPLWDFLTDSWRSPTHPLSPTCSPSHMHMNTRTYAHTHSPTHTQTHCLTSQCELFGGHHFSSCPRLHLTYSAELFFQIWEVWEREIPFCFVFICTVNISCSYLVFIPCYSSSAGRAFCFPTITTHILRDIQTHDPRSGRDGEAEKKE